MSTKITLLLALAATVPLPAGLRAGDRAAPPTAGHVLILENERTLEGDIERAGGQYRIRHAVGETWVPAERVLRLCADYPDAYAYLRTQANLRDPDEHVRLARWCQEHGLREQGLAEVRAALDLQPDHPEARRLLQGLTPVLDTQAGAASHPDHETGPAAPPIELTLESLGQFATRVQPILMNTCASCHVSGRGGSFKLVRVYDAGMLSRRATQQNVAAVMAQVNRRRWPVSPFLVKAVSAHGHAPQPPLPGRQTPAYRALEEWVQTTLATNPGLEEQEPVTTAGPFAAEPSPPASGLVKAQWKQAPGWTAHVPQLAQAAAEREEAAAEQERPNRGAKETRALAPRVHADALRASATFPEPRSESPAFSSDSSQSQFGIDRKQRSTAGEPGPLPTTTAPEEMPAAEDVVDPTPFNRAMHPGTAGEKDPGQAPQ